MRIPSAVAVALATTLSEASVLPRAAGGACPAAWTQVSQQLTAMFVGADGQCTDDARSAVRAVFHDCGTWNKAQGNTGGCDGSVFLSAEENARIENRGLQSIAAKLTAVATQNGVGVADMIAFAGSHATVSCPLGPTVKTMVGRKDSSNAAPNEMLLPGNATLSADAIISSFADKGFSAPDVAALVGAHTSAKQFNVDPTKAGEPQDRTPGVWDVDFYSDTTTKPAGVFVFQSDSNLAADPRSGPTFKSFVGQQARWNAAFADTMARLELLGVAADGLVDCTSALPPPKDGGAPGAPPTGPTPPTGAPSGAPRPPKGPGGIPTGPMPPMGAPSGGPKPPGAPAPPTGQPPTGQPPAGQPPRGQPPVGQPPAGQPPAGQPPAGQPPKGQPPAGQPPAGLPGNPGQQGQGQPPRGQPPAGQPPAGLPGNPGQQGQGQQGGQGGQGQGQQGQRPQAPGNQGQGGRGQGDQGQGQVGPQRGQGGQGGQGGRP